MKTKTAIPAETYVPAELLRSKKIPVVEELPPDADSKWQALAVSLGILVTLTLLFGPSRLTVFLWTSLLGVLAIVLTLTGNRR